MEQGASQPSTMSRPRCLHEDPVIGAYSVSEELQPILATSPFKRLRRLKQLGVSSRARFLPSTEIEWLGMLKSELVIVPQCAETYLDARHSPAKQRSSVTGATASFRNDCFILFF